MPVSPLLIRFAAAVAFLAMAGSLYASEVLGFVPCALCWIQRACMYPLALQLLLSGGRLDVLRYVAPLVTLGALTALIQNLEAWGFIAPLKVCLRSAAPCDVPWPLWATFGVPALDRLFTLPVLSLLAFVLIGLLLLGAFVTRERGESQ